MTHPHNSDFYDLLMTVETDAKSSLDSHRYRRLTEPSHLTRVLIFSADTPFFPAVVAAPIRNYVRSRRKHPLPLLLGLVSQRQQSSPW
jgi:hypothetical protein